MRPDVPEMKNRLEPEIFFSDPEFGFRIVRWRGNRGDYSLITIPPGGMRKEQFPFASLMISGWMRTIHSADPDYYSDLTPDNPNGGDQIRPAGLITMLAMEDGMERQCASPINAQGDRDFGSFDEFYVLGRTTHVIVPKGGIFLLGKGTIQLRGETLTGTQVFRAVSGPLEFDAPDGTYGIALWRT